MSAQIRPNRMEVTDRFPMLGFSVRTDEPNVNAEVVLATDIGLFQQQHRTSRTAANFYSSREHGLLTVPRGEGVFVVPPDVLARFIGTEKLYFGLATGRKDNGGLHVDALPRDGSPYVALRGFTGRTLRRNFGGVRHTGTPVLEWAGDTSRPGSEPAAGTTPGNGKGANGNGSSEKATVSNDSAPVGMMSEYNDGFGELPALPGDQRQRARRIGGAFADRVGEALDLGLAPTSVDPLLNVLEPRAAPAPLVETKGARGMDAGVSAAIMIGGFLLETLRDSKGDVSWELDQFAHIKHPNDVAPANPAPFRDAPTIKLDDWPVWEGLIDDISAWFKIDWQYNGLSLGNVRIENIGTNDRVGFSLHVRARIMDDNRLHPPSNCAALRLTFHYHFDRSIGSEGIAIREVTLYGDGRYETKGEWLQSSAFSRQQSLVRAGAGPDPAPRGRPVAPPSLSGGVRTFGRLLGAGADAAKDAAGFILDTIRGSKGDVSWELDQFAQIKHPNDVAPANAAPFRDGQTIKLDDWPVWEGLIDDISAWFKIDWQYNGLSLGNVRIENIGTNDRVGFSLHVRARIMNDNRLHPPSNCAALRLTFHYHFDRSIGSEGIAVREVTLYGDGRYETKGEWLQASAFSRQQSLPRARAKSEEEQMLQVPPPPARPRAMGRTLGAGADAAIAIGGFLLETLRDSKGDISWELDQFRHIKHPNDVAPASAGAFRDGATIKLDDWPVWKGVDDISAWFKIDWQYNGLSLGNVRIENIGTNDAIGFSLHVRARIMDDNRLHPPSNCAGLRLTFHYHFDRSIGSEGIAIREVTLYGDGTYETSGEWLQSSAFSRQQSAQRGYAYA